MFLSNLLDSPNPTVFELSMSGNLASTLKPAFEYLLQVLGERYAVFFHISGWKDEVFMALHLIVQRHYLAVYDGSFAENFYALKRTKRAPGPSGELEPLTSGGKLGSLMLLVLAPYVMGKVVKRHQEAATAATAAPALASIGAATPGAAAGGAEPRAQRTQYQTLVAQVIALARRGFLRGLPLAQAAYETWALLLKLLFMFEKSEHFSPAQWLQGVVVARVSGDDMRRQALAEELQGSKRGLLGRVVGKVALMLRSALIASALVFKLVEWFYSPENQSQRESMKGPALVPPPPMPPVPHADGVRMPRDARLCPLCHEPRVNVAASSSGVVFCYLCIHRHVLEHGRCPVTGTPCQVTQIRRIFAS